MYRIFVTDTLKLISKNVASAVRGGEYMSVRYWDWLHPHVENRTPDEIIGNIRGRLRSIKE